MSTKRNRRKPPVKRRTSPGTPPGTLVVDPDAPRPIIQVMAFGPETFEEATIVDPGEIREMRGRHPVTWVNVDGLGDLSVLTVLAEIFGLHPLAVEDVLHVGQRSKLDEYEHHDFIVVRMARGGPHFETEQLSIFVAQDVLLTFQEAPGDCLDPVRKRIRASRNRIRSGGTGYLAYCILDAVVDAYFPLLESLADELLVLEDRLLTEAGSVPVATLYEHKRDLMALRSMLWPLRETVSALVRGESSILASTTEIYLRDLQDHTLQLLERADDHRELASSLVELHRSNQTARMTEVMKVLTMMSSVFIPLTFIVGVYGMNFDTGRSRWNMPELLWPFGYVFVLALMAGVAVGMLIFFRHKGWLGRS